jgi:hypothetical protein
LSHLTRAKGGTDFQCFAASKPALISAAFSDGARKNHPAKNTVALAQNG